MDVSVLRKRLNTFKSGKGVLSKVSDEVVFGVLRAWENWPGSTADLYRELGLTKMQMVVMIKKGKKLVKSGVMAESDFSELKIEPWDASPAVSQVGIIELQWEAGRIIRFSHVDHLLDFLRKAA